MNRSLVLLAVVLGACGGGGQSSTGQCKQQSDCQTGQFCNPSGFCQTNLGCTTNAQCPNGQTCDLTSGQCFCSGAAQCPAGQTCNNAGKCQVPASCQSNQDCATNLICDSQSHVCIPAATCKQNVQCPQGQVCSATTGTCQPGCTTDGDCVLVDYTHTPPVYQPAACIGFQCVPNGCHSSSNCATYATCVNNTCQNQCGATQFCQSCDPTSLTGCPNNGLCLTDPADSASCQGLSASCKFFCGLDCGHGQPCPNGSFCSTVTAIGSTPDVPGGPCNLGDTCQGSGACQVAEGQQSGACPCMTNTDCPGFGLAGINCVQGACVVGYQCGPTKQYTCQTNNCGGG